VARIYSNENIPIQVVAELRRLGHDVLTSWEAGRQTPPCRIWKFWLRGGRRPDFVVTQPPSLPRSPSTPNMDHAGIVLCTFDPKSSQLAQRIDAAYWASLT